MHQIDFDIAALLYHRLVISPTTRTLAGYQIQGIKGRIREHRLKAVRGGGYSADTFIVVNS
jgi:hypothetical protein